MNLKIVGIGFGIACAFVITSIILLIILYKNDTLIWKANTVKAFVTTEAVFVFLMCVMLGISAIINVNSEYNTKKCTEERRQMGTAYHAEEQKNK